MRNIAFGIAVVLMPFFSPEQTPYFGSNNYSPTLETPKATDLYPLT